MKINGVGPGSVSGRTEPTRRPAGDAAASPEEIRVGAVDRAEISSEGMSRARDAQQAEAAQVGMEKSHIELIQTRIESGFYKQPEVVDEIARRIVSAGDL
jgi:hypothetical protein